jgi:opacity protein-like surface antigen
MRKLFIGLSAAVAVAMSLASPASAQGRYHGGHHGGGHWGGGQFRGGPSIGFSFDSGYGAYGYECPLVRVRHVTPRGQVIYRYVRNC